MNYKGKLSKTETAHSIKNDIGEYIYDLSQVMGYINMPTIKVELEGPFMTVNFLDNKEKRLDTFGDLLFYMETGVNQSGDSNGL